MNHATRAFSWAAIALAAFSTLSTGVAFADEAEKTEEEVKAPAKSPIPTNRLYLKSRESLRLNPIGLQSENQLLYQRRLMDSDSALFSNTFFNIGVYNRLSPAFVTVGPTLTIQPIALFSLTAGAEVNQYFGNFDQILSWDDAGADYHDIVQDNLGGDVSDPPENYKTNGYHVFLRPTFQIKGGPVAIKSAFSLEYWGLNLEDDDTLFYEFTADMLVPNKGWTVMNDTDILYFTKKRLIIGARYSRVAPRYTAENFTTSTEDSVNNNQQRAGLIAVLPVGKKAKYSAFHSQALVAILSYYVQHNYRGNTEKSVEPAEPPVYFAFVYTFTSDFLK